MSSKLLSPAEIIWKNLCVPILRYAIHRKDMILAGKTGTAEIKESQSDTTGTELGWFAVMTPDKKNKKPILIVSMVEDVKGIGGSGYVVKKDKAVLDKWFGKN